MRFLMCSLSSPGFLYPVIGLAGALRCRGHDVRFVANGTTASLVEGQGFGCMRGRVPVDCFDTRQWFAPLSVGLQYKYVERAIGEFEPDAIVAQPLALGSILAAERRGVRVAMMGFATYLWPSARDRHDVGEAAREAIRRREWRARDINEHFNRARRAVGMPELLVDLEGSPLLGDLFLLRTVPELEPCVELLPSQVHVVGPCLWEPAPVEEDLVAEKWMSEEGSEVYYVHHGRVFDERSFWADAVTAFGGAANIRVVACVGRMDREVGAVPVNFLTRYHIAQGRVLRRAAVAVATAHTTVALGALSYAVPNVLIPGGGEQADLAERCRAAGVSTVLKAEDVTVETLRAAVRNAIARPSGALCEVAAALTRDGGFRRAADLVEVLGKTGGMVRR